MRHNTLKKEYQKRVAQIRRDLDDTDNPNKKRRLQRALDDFRRSYAGPACNAANGAWSQQLKRFQDADESLAAAEKKARAKVRREANEYVQVPRLEAKSVSDRDIKRWVRQADTPEDGYARYLAAVERSESTPSIQPGPNDFHTSDPSYQRAAERAQKIATETNDLNNDIAGPAGLLDTFDDVRLSVQVGRWQVDEGYDGDGIRTTYSVEKDPTDFREVIEKVGTYT